MSIDIWLLSVTQHIFICIMNINKTQSKIRTVKNNIEIHSSSVVFILILRVLMGGMMLFAGLSKYTGDRFNAER